MANLEYIRGAAVAVARKRSDRWEVRALNQVMTESRMRKERQSYRGTGGASEGGRSQGPSPALDGRVLAVKTSDIRGFVRGARFFTRDEAPGLARVKSPFETLE